MAAIAVTASFTVLALVIVLIMVKLGGSGGHTQPVTQTVTASAPVTQIVTVRRPRRPRR